MIVENYSQMNEEHKDVLLELGNIGTGNALTALTQMTNEPIHMELPRVQITTLEQLPDEMCTVGEQNAGVVITVQGDLECVVTFLLNEHFNCIVAERLTGEPLERIDAMDEMQCSAICEVGNIMCNAYLNALAAMLGANLEVSVPNLHMGSCQEILKVFQAEFDDQTQEILIVENTFRYAGEEVTSHILLHPKFHSVQRILEQLI